MISSSSSQRHHEHHPSANNSNTIDQQGTAPMPTTPATMQCAIRLNNEGVHAFLHGSIVESQQPFSEALKLLRTELDALMKLVAMADDDNTESNHDGIDGRHNGNGNDNGDGIIMMSHAESTTAWPQHCICVDVSSRRRQRLTDDRIRVEDGGAMFRKAIFISEDDADVASASSCHSMMASYRTLVSIVLFNIALLYHENGIIAKDGKAASTYLCKAGALYGSLQQFLQVPLRSPSASMSTSTSSSTIPMRFVSPIVYLVQVATMNNMAVLHQQRQDHALATRCFQSLACLLHQRPAFEDCGCFNEWLDGGQVLSEMPLNVFVAEVAHDHGLQAAASA